MDEAIKNLESWTDEATKQILQNIINKKRKFDKKRNTHLIIMWLTVIVFFVYFLFLYKVIILPYSYSFAAIFSAFVNHSANPFFLVFSFGLFGYMNVLKKKVDKLEDEFHALRCEIVDKSTDLWKKDEAWEKRHLVFKLMKEKYDINLYHENK